jgi:recombination protein RecT
MPKSTELAQGIAADESVRVDLTETAIDYPQHVEGEVVEPEPQPTDEAA